MDIYLDGILSQEDDLYFLKQYSKFEKYSKNNKITFEYVNEEIDDLKKYLPLDFFKDENHNFKSMIKIMLWVHDFLIPNGAVVLVRPFNCINILEKTRTEKIKSNCWMYAVVLNEIFLSFGYKSKMIRCMPFDLRFNDCHCVVQAYVGEYDKWVMFDAAFATYYTDKQKRPLNLKEIREYIIMNRDLYTPLTPSKYSKQLIKYWTKNIFRFETYAKSAYGAEENSNLVMYSLLPIGYELTNKLIKHNGHDLEIIHTHNEINFWEE